MGYKTGYALKGYSHYKHSVPHLERWGNTRVISLYPILMGAPYKFIADTFDIRQLIIELNYEYE